MELAELAETYVRQQRRQQTDTGEATGAGSGRTLSERYYGASPETGSASPVPDRKLTR